MTHTFAKLLVVTAVAVVSFYVGAKAGPVSVVSDNKSQAWTVSETYLDSMGQPATKDLGAPQFVCLNAPTTTPPTPPVPATCPAGATSYGYPYPGWIADLSSYSPSAKWIWASQKSDGTPITGETTGAGGAEFSFKTRFFLCGASPKDGTIWVAADDTVEAFVNGVLIPLTLIPNSPVVYKGTVPAGTLKPSPDDNVIELKVKNGADPSDCATDQYKCNPAGVIFVGQFGDELKSIRCANPLRRQEK